MQRQQLSARWAISEMTTLVTCQRFSPVRQYSWSLDDDDGDDDDDDHDVITMASAGS